MVKIVDRKRKWDKIIKEVSALKKNPVVGVGYPESKVDNGIIVYAATNHFGTHSAGRGNSVTIPPRPFIAVTIDLNKEKIFNLKKKLGYMLLAGEITAKRGLGILGSVVTGMIKKTISGDYFKSNVPNAPSTIFKKNHAAIEKARVTVALTEARDEISTADLKRYLGAKHTVETGGNVTPLIDHGIMRKATTWEVFMNGKPND